MSLAGMNAIALGQPGGLFSGLTSGLASLLDAYERRQGNDLGRAEQARSREAEFRDRALLEMLNAPISESRLQPTTTWNEETGERSTTNAIVPFDRPKTAKELRDTAEQLGFLDRLGLAGPSPAESRSGDDVIDLPQVPQRQAPQAAPAPGRAEAAPAAPAAPAAQHGRAVPNLEALGSQARAGRGRAMLDAAGVEVPPALAVLVDRLPDADAEAFAILAQRAKSGDQAAVERYRTAIQRLQNAHAPIRGTGPTAGRTQDEMVRAWTEALGGN